MNLMHFNALINRLGLLPDDNFDPAMGCYQSTSDGRSAWTENAVVSSIPLLIDAGNKASLTGFASLMPEWISAGGQPMTPDCSYPVFNRLSYGRALARFLGIQPLLAFILDVPFWFEQKQTTSKPFLRQLQNIVKNGYPLNKPLRGRQQPSVAFLLTLVAYGWEGPGDALPEKLVGFDACPLTLKRAWDGLGITHMLRVLKYMRKELAVAVTVPDVPAENIVVETYELPVIRLDRLKAVIDILPEDPKDPSFNMRAWQAPKGPSALHLSAKKADTVSELHSCGNTACIAGFAALTQEWREGGGYVVKDGDAMTRISFDGAYGAEAFAVFVGLPRRVARLVTLRSPYDYLNFTRFESDLMMRNAIQEALTQPLPLNNFFDLKKVERVELLAGAYRMMLVAFGWKEPGDPIPEEVTRAIALDGFDKLWGSWGPDNARNILNYIGRVYARTPEERQMFE